MKLKTNIVGEKRNKMLCKIADAMKVIVTKILFHFLLHRKGTGHFFSFQNLIVHRKETVHSFIFSQNLTGPDPPSVRPQWLYVTSKVKKKPLVARTVRVEVKEWLENRWLDVLFSLCVGFLGVKLLARETERLGFLSAKLTLSHQLQY